MSFFLDSLFQIRDDGNPTRIAMFQCAGISVNTTRTLTIQDQDGTIALLSDIPTVITDHGSLTGLTGTDHHTQYALLAGRAGAALVFTNAVNTDGVLRVNALAGTTSDIFSVERAATQWFRVAGDGQSYFTSSTTAGIVNIGGAAGSTSLSIGTSGSTSIMNHVLGASDFNYRVTGTGAITWRHTTAGSALAGTFDGNFLFQPPTGTTTTVPVTIKGRASQTGNLTEWQDSAGTPTLLVNAAGNFTDNLFKIVDNTDITKTLKFDLGGLQTGVDITQAFSSAAGGGDRTISWSFTGASGTAGPTFAIPITTVARTYTLPNATVTLAGLQLAQTFTRTQTITPTTGTDVLILTTDDGSGISSGLKITDSVIGDQLLFTVNVGLAIAGGYQFYPSGVVGTGFSGTIGVAETLTAGRAWNFLNFGGTIPVGGTPSEGTNQGADVSTNLVTSTTNTNTKWIINLYLVCTTSGGAGGTVVGTIGWSDVSGARTHSITLPLSATGRQQTSIFIQVQTASAITLVLDYTTGGGSTERYAYYATATRVA